MERLQSEMVSTRQKMKKYSYFFVYDLFSVRFTVYYRNDWKIKMNPLAEHCMFRICLCPCREGTGHLCGVEGLLVLKQQSQKWWMLINAYLLFIFILFFFEQFCYTKFFVVKIHCGWLIYLIFHYFHSFSWKNFQLKIIKTKKLLKIFNKKLKLMIGKISICFI